MPEKQTEVKTYKIYYLCDNCGHRMIPTGIALMTNPPAFTHTCINNHIINLPHQYPVITYEEVN